MINCDVPGKQHGSWHDLDDELDEGLLDDGLLELGLLDDGLLDDGLLDDGLLDDGLLDDGFDDDGLLLDGLLDEGLLELGLLEEGLLELDDDDELGTIQQHPPRLLAIIKPHRRNRSNRQHSIYRSSWHR